MSATAPSFITGQTKSYPSGGTVVVNRLVKVSSLGVVTHADHTERAIGWAQNNAALGDTVVVRLINSQGTILAVADGVIVAGATVFGTDGGKVNDTDPGSALKVGTCLFPGASADGDLVEVLIGCPIS